MMDERKRYDVYDENHGHGVLSDCLWCVISKFDDGYIWCILHEQGTPCEECLNSYEAMIDE